MESTASNRKRSSASSASSASSPAKQVWVKSLVLFLVLIFYLLIGAFVFRAFERPTSLRVATEFDAALRRFAEDYNCMGEVGVDELMELTIVAIREGGYDVGRSYATVIKRNESLIYEVWKLEQSFIFAFTVVSTIGYGTLTPRTNLGQGVCILYAVIGIPLMGFLLLTVGELVGLMRHRHANLLDKYCTKCFAMSPRFKTTLVVINSSVIVPDCSHLQDGRVPLSELWIEKIVNFIFLFIALGTIAMTFSVMTKKQQRVARSFTSIVTQSTVWTRLQFHFRKDNEDGDDDTRQRTTTKVTTHDGFVDEERRSSAAQMRWSRIRMSVDYSVDTHDALSKLRQGHIERERRRSSSKSGNQDGPEELANLDAHDELNEELRKDKITIIEEGIIVE